ncbi:MAG: hypothetical protein H0U95_11635 [Bacteroidetes bacterium]|nr:hypothetical protein [Bacteroidota bacterium]
MKTSKIYLGLAITLIAGSITFSSCRKKEKTPETPADNEQSTATDNNLAESTSSDIESMGSQVCESFTMTTFRTSGNDIISLAPCASVITNTATKSYTVDFGTTGCVGTDGRTRTGKLFFNYSGSTPATAIYYRNPGFKLVVTSSNYVVDGNAVTINNKTITNTTPAGAPAGTNLTWLVSADISIAKANNGGNVSWTCTRVKELTNSFAPCYNGQTTSINWTLAKIKINGDASGSNTKGESFTAHATNLVRDFTCAPDNTKPHRHPFISGTISYTPGSRPTRLIDFGNGACDFNGTITINGQTWSFTLQ